MAVDYKKIGLVNTKEMFARAIKGGWAVPAFNFNNLEQLQAIIQASSNLKSPVILQVSKGARKYANPTLLRYLAEGAVEYAKELCSWKVFRIFSTAFIHTSPKMESSPVTFQYS